MAPKRRQARKLEPEKAEEPQASSKQASSKQQAHAAATETARQWRRQRWQRRVTATVAAGSGGDVGTDSVCCEDECLDQQEEAEEEVAQEPGQEEHAEEEFVRDSRDPPLLSVFPIIEVTTAGMTKQQKTAQGLELPEKYLHTLIGSMLDRLSVADTNALRGFVEKFQPFRYASACAGTDCPALVVKAIAEVMQARNINCTVDHLWSSEIHPAKRQFLRTMFPASPHLYGDLETVLGDEALDYAMAHSSSGRKSTTSTTVPKTFKGVIGGFPCTSVSSMNCHRESSRDAIKDGKGKTGSVWRLILQLLDSVDGGVQGEGCTDEGGFMWALFENVLGLSTAPKNANGTRMDINDSNLGKVLDSLYRRGHLPFVLLLHPEEYGHPVSRPRYYIPVVSRELIDTFGISEVAFYSWLQELSRMFAGHGRVHLESFVLPESSHAVVDMLREAKSKGRRAIHFISCMFMRELRIAGLSMGWGRVGWRPQNATEGIPRVFAFA